MCSYGIWTKNYYYYIVVTSTHRDGETTGTCRSAMSCRPGLESNLRRSWQKSMWRRLENAPKRLLHPPSLTSCTIFADSGRTAEKLGWVLFREHGETTRNLTAKRAAGQRSLRFPPVFRVPSHRCGGDAREMGRCFWQSETWGARPWPSMFLILSRLSKHWR